MQFSFLCWVKKAVSKLSPDIANKGVSGFHFIAKFGFAWGIGLGFVLYLVSDVSSDASGTDNVNSRPFLRKMTPVNSLASYYAKLF